MYKVKATTKPNKLAWAIFKGVKEGNPVEMQCIGPAAVNQGMKGIIVARGLLTTAGIEVKMLPSFEAVETEKGEITAIKMMIEGVENGSKI